MEGENPKGAGSGGGKGGKNCSRDGLVLESRELTDAQNPARHPDSHGLPGQKRNTPPMPELVLLRHQAGCSRHLAVSAGPSGWWNCGWDVRVTGCQLRPQCRCGQTAKLETLGSGGRRGKKRLAWKLSPHFSTENHLIPEHPLSWTQTPRKTSYIWVTLSPSVTSESFYGSIIRLFIVSN